MKIKSKVLNFLNIIVLCLLLIVTICGVTSFSTEHKYEAVNQYGETINIFGSGIYAHDSYFKAPIFIGSDLTILLIVIPMFIYTIIKMNRVQNIENYIKYFSIMSLILYYSASLAFGVTYNSFHLIYIALFGISFYIIGFFYSKFIRLTNINFEYSVTKGMIIFLVIAGTALFVAWLPDIITSLIQGKSLDLIEVYTTEITYVLDMGIISPLIFITLYLVVKRSFIGYILLRMLLKVCAIIGIMLPIQTLFQLLCGIELPLPALISKVASFVLLAFFAVLFEHKIKKDF